MIIESFQVVSMECFKIQCLIAIYLASSLLHVFRKRALTYICEKILP